MNYGKNFLCIFLAFCCTKTVFAQLESKAPDTPTTDVGSFASNEEFQSRLNAKGLALINQKECGLQKYETISNKEIANPAEFPWMALIIYDYPNGVPLCGGSLISNRYVITAAHCIFNPPQKLIGVRLGDYDTKSDPDCVNMGKDNICMPPYEDFGIEKQIIHPGFDIRSLTNDLALIRLDRNVDYKVHIKPVCLPTSLERAEPIQYILAGWNLRARPIESTVLKKAELVHVPRSVCRKIFSAINLTESHICAGSKGQSDTCHGDSGGPLISPENLEGQTRFVQFGVLSFGIKKYEGQSSLPDVYTYIIEHMTWITDTISK